MDGRQRIAGRILLTLALLFGLCGAQPLEVKDDACSCVVATPRPDAKLLLIVSSLASQPGPYHVTLRTDAAEGPERIPLAKAPVDPAWTRQITELQGRLAKARRAAVPLDDFAPAVEPPRQRSFSLFVRDNNFLDPAGYVTVTGELRAVGRHCQVYVDRDWPDPDGLQPTIADAVRTFDEEVYPQACQHLGRVLDVDRDGRFTILFTGWLAKLCDGKVALGGFVRGSDFYRDLAAPLSNRCDMMYLSTALQPGGHLRSLIAHEYTHAVVFCEHVFGTYLPEQPARDEEGWLNEGLAHLNEAAHGYSWSNLDYRIAAFLDAPERCGLVIPDYHAAGLWRSPGHRGATFLFLRWCAEHYGPDLPARLIQTNLTGTANLETATGVPFSELFRQWLVAQAMDEASLPRMGRLLCGPRFREVALAGASCTVELAGTSGAYLLLHSPPGRFARLSVQADAGTGLQATLIPLPDKLARLSVSPSGTGRTVRLALTAQDADVELQDAAWERLTLAGTAEDTNYRAETPPKTVVRAWFGDPHLHRGETRTSGVIELPDAVGPFLFKVTATDEFGRRVVGWAVFPVNPR